MKALRCLIVDDEPLAQRRLQALLGEMDGVEVVGVAGDGQTALRRIQQQAPDLVLLDVRMPGANGLELMEQLGDRVPAVIFVTAFSEFATDAFDLAATDYLLKPIDPVRLATALARARARVEARLGAERVEELQAVLAQLRRAERAAPVAPWAREVWVSNRNERVSIPVEQIDWVRAERDYVRLHTGTLSHLLREPITALEARLDPDQFARVHRSALVRLDRVRRIRHTGGGLRLVLASGAEVPVARARAALVRRLVVRRPRRTGGAADGA